MLFALDADWWERYGAEAAGIFAGARVSTHRQTAKGVYRERLQYPNNSGAAALALAVHWGASRVVLLGYDCQLTGGQAHWHGDHPEGLGNAGQVRKWPAQFRELVPRLGNAQVINATRETALACFPRMNLEDALA